MDSPTFLLGLRIAIGAVWIYHGLYSKILNGIPRHQEIVGRILGQTYARLATKVIGSCEVLLGLWVFSGWEPLGCAAVQTLAIIAMNALEIAIAADLLISAVGMVALNVGFLSAVWYGAIHTARG